MAKIIYTTYQTNNFKIIKSTFIIYELPHALVIFPLSLGIFNCFENSDRAENFRQTVPIYGWGAGGCPSAPPEFPPLLSVQAKQRAQRLGKEVDIYYQFTMYLARHLYILKNICI